MQQQIRPHDSDDDIFNALQVLVFGMNDDHPEVFDRVLKYYSHEVLGQFFRVMGKKQEEELNEKENKD